MDVYVFHQSLLERAAALAHVLMTNIEHRREEVSLERAHSMCMPSRRNQRRIDYRRDPSHRLALGATSAFLPGLVNARFGWGAATGSRLSENRWR